MSSSPPRLRITAAEAAPLAPSEPGGDESLRVRGSAACEPLTYDGVCPGATTVDALHARWGTPRATSLEGGIRYEQFDIEPFARLEAGTRDGRVVSVLFVLRQPAPLESVTAELGLVGTEPAALRDSAGTLIGLAFPERGVVVAFAPGRPGQVERVGLQAIAPQAFLLRARERPRSQTTAALADLEAALALDPELAEAHAARAELLGQLGRVREALAASERAVRAAPRRAEHRVMWSERLAAMGQYDEALAACHEALRLAEGSPLVEARCWAQLGDLLARGPRHDSHQALEFHLQAIRAAEPLAAAPTADRAAAHTLLVEAHLSAAQDIALGAWRSKAEVTLKWLDRAKTLADTAPGGAGQRGELRRLVYRKALAAGVALGDPFDPRDWAEPLLAESRQQIDAAADPLWKRQLEWELGLGLYDALQSAQLRGDHDQALEYGGLAVAFVERGRVGRDESAADRYLAGRLYYRVGLVYALGRANHAEAVRWYERARPLLDSISGAASAGDPGRRGETLVSMAVSYWSIGRHDEALRLCAQGAEQMQAAVDAGQLDAAALRVPYANLSQMHAYLGDTPRARKYAETAAALDGAALR